MATPEFIIHYCVPKVFLERTSQLSWSKILIPRLIMVWLLLKVTTTTITVRRARVTWIAMLTLSMILIRIIQLNIIIKLSIMFTTSRPKDPHHQPHPTHPLPQSPWRITRKAMLPHRFAIHIIIILMFMVVIIITILRLIYTKPQHTLGQYHFELHQPQHPPLSRRRHHHRPYNNNMSSKSSTATTIRRRRQGLMIATIQLLTRRNKTRMNKNLTFSFPLLQTSSLPFLLLLLSILPLYMHTQIPNPRWFYIPIYTSSKLAYVWNITHMHTKSIVYAYGVAACLLLYPQVPFPSNHIKMYIWFFFKTFFIM